MISYPESSFSGRVTQQLGLWSNKSLPNPAPPPFTTLSIGRNTWIMSPARRSRKVYFTRMNFPSTYLSWERSFYWGAGRNLSDNQQQTVFKKQAQKDYLTRYIDLRFISVIQSNLQKAWNEVLNAAHFKTEVANLYSNLRLRNNAIHYFD